MIEYKELPIEKIKMADYNPRQMSKEDFENLKKVIKLEGLVEPLVVNKRTGYTIVGGNHRYKALKELGYDKVMCAVVDIPLHREKSLNIALNRISGVFVEDKLNDIINELVHTDIGLDYSGLSDFEIDMALFEDTSVDVDNFDIGVFDGDGNTMTPSNATEDFDEMSESEPVDIDETVEIDQKNSIIKCPHCNKEIKVKYNGGND